MKFKTTVILLTLLFALLLVDNVLGQDEESMLEEIEQYADNLKDLIEKYEEAEIDLIKTENVTIRDRQGIPQDCDVAIFYNNGNQPRFTTKGGSFEGNFDHGNKMPTRPFSIRLSNCPCRPISTVHTSSWDEINEVIEKIKKVIEDEIEDTAWEKAKELAEKGVEKVFDKLGYGGAAAGFLSGFGYGAELGQPIGDYLTDSINQILDTVREKNIEAAEHLDFSPLYPNVGHLKPRGLLGNLLGTNPQLKNDWEVIVQCGTRTITPSRASWHKVQDPIRTPPPPAITPPGLTEQERRDRERQERERLQREREEQQRWEQEQRERKQIAQQKREEAQRKFEEEQRKIRQKAKEISKTCQICDPIRQHIEDTNEKIKDKEQQIAQLEIRVAEAEKELQNAEKNLEDAQNKLDNFRNPESWVENGQGRITSSDLEVQRELSRENWQKFQDGEQTAEETMDNWENQHDPDTHEAAKERIEERLEKEVQDAQQKAEQARQNLDKAKQDLNQANNELKQLNDQKNHLLELLEECLKKCRERAEDIVRGNISTYAELLDIEPFVPLVFENEIETSADPEEDPETPDPEEKLEESNTDTPVEQPDQTSFFDSFPSPDLGLLSGTAGIQLDFATRNRFRNAVCDQQGLMECHVDGLTPVYVAFAELDLWEADLSHLGIGSLPVGVGMSVTRGRVNFQQGYASGIAGPDPFLVDGRVNVTTLDFYGRTGLNLAPLNNWPFTPAFSPYFRMGFTHIWNRGRFDFGSPGSRMGFNRKHNGLNFTGGIGTDINFDGFWGARLNLDYMGGGADANFRFGGGVIFRY